MKSLSIYFDAPSDGDQGTLLLIRTKLSLLNYFHLKVAALDAFYKGWFSQSGVRENSDEHFLGETHKFLIPGRRNFRKPITFQSKKQKKKNFISWPHKKFEIIISSYW